jgi:hypothetical protein
MLAFGALQLAGDPEHRAVDGGAIIGGQLNKTAEFDQMLGSLAAIELPGAQVVANQSRLPAIVSCPVALERREGCAEMPEQGTASDCVPAFAPPSGPCHGIPARWYVSLGDSPKSVR